MAGEIEQQQDQAQLQPQEQAPAPTHTQDPAPQADGQRDAAVDNVLMLVDTMEAGDSQHLASLIQQHPEMRDQILAYAAETLGNDTVSKAIAILQGGNAEEPKAETKPDAPDAPPLSEQQRGLLFSLQILEPGAAQELAGILGRYPEMFDLIVAEAEQYVGAEAVKQAIAIVRGTDSANESKPEPTPTEQIEENASQHAGQAEAPQIEEESGWVVRARAYNANHGDAAAEFNQLTAGACLGANGQLDPNLVANWQVAHGVEPDGRVGDDTLAAARAGGQPDQSAAPVPEPQPDAPPPA